MSETRVILVPGWDGSGPQHWQSIWQAHHAEYVRVEQSDWLNPICSEWVRSLDLLIAESIQPTVLAAHSLGCATVIHWAATHRRNVCGALLVAPTDVDRPTLPHWANSFRPMPLSKLDFPSIVVSSNNDPYVKAARAALFAEAWGSKFVNLGDAGHINSAAGFGLWQEGERLLAQLINRKVE